MRRGGLAVWAALWLAAPGAICGAMAGAAPAWAEAPIVLSVRNLPPLANGDGSGIAERMAVEAFRRIGLKAVFALAPAERSLENVESGVDDGELPRVAGLQTRYPHLRIVDEPLMRVALSAFVRKGEAGSVTWNNMGGRRVGYVRGWKIFETHLAGKPNVEVFNHPADLFRNLANREIDVALFNRMAGSDYVRSHKLSIRAVEPPLLSRNVYLYLNKRHAALLKPLGDALRAMKRDGTYRKILGSFNGARHPGGS